jgi:hypothetical protein
MTVRMEVHEDRDSWLQRTVMRTAMPGRGIRTFDSAESDQRPPFAFATAVRSRVAAVTRGQ